MKPLPSKLPFSFALTTLACCVGSAADPLHAIAQGAVQHHDSGWIFPQQLAGFTRAGNPQDVDGSRDAVAYYARVEQGRRSTAAVDIYAKDSAVGPSLLAAQVAIEREATAAAAKRARTRLRLPNAPGLEGTKITYTKASSALCLYWVDAGDWIVKIRITSVTPDACASDAFARAQRWNSLGTVLQN